MEGSRRDSFIETLQSEPRRSSAGGEAPNFVVHGRPLTLPKRSLGLFSASSSIRKAAVWITRWRAFEVFILAAVIANSIVLACSDFRHVDENNNLLPVGWRNVVVTRSEPVFTAIFITEAVLKIVALGFAFHPNSYLRDWWNVLDCGIVVAAVLSLIPGMPNIVFLRSFRLLRPLRSVTLIPSLRILVLAIFNALHPIFNAFLLLMFIIFLLAVIGLQITMGTGHGHCRLTQLPIKFAVGDPVGPCNSSRAESCWTALLHDNGLPEQEVYVAHLDMMVSSRVNASQVQRCLPGNNAAGSSKSNSVWHVAQDCFWPVDVHDTRLCTVFRGGLHSCGAARWCGNNFDKFGNPKFARALVQQGADMQPDTNFGYTTFDSIFRAMLTVFQCVTREGWSEVMYQVMDGFSGVFGAVFMVFVILFCSDIAVNLFLSAIWVALGDARKSFFLRAKSARKLKRSMSAAAGAAASPSRRSRPSDGAAHDPSALAIETPSTDAGSPQQSADRSDLSQSSKHGARGLPVAGSVLPPSRAARFCAALTASLAYSSVMELVILANAITICYKAGVSSGPVLTRLQIVNAVFVTVFCVDIAVRAAAISATKFLRNEVYMCDAAIVVIGVITIIHCPPGHTPGRFPSLQALQVLRVFWLFRGWGMVRKLLVILRSATWEIASFLVLLLLFIYVFALIGMQLFANKFCFDPYTSHPTQAYPLELCQSRSHFDNFPRALVTVFQIWTTEGWNFVMYDSWRAVGWVSVFYYICLQVVGRFVAINVFLAIILVNFVAHGADDQWSVEQSQQCPGLVSLVAQLHAQLHRCLRRLEANHPFCSRCCCRGAQATQMPQYQPGIRHQAAELEVQEVIAVQLDACEPAGMPDVTPPPKRSATLARAVRSVTTRVQNTALAIVAWPWFDRIVLASIALSTVTVALDNPLLSPRSRTARAISACDVILAIVFAMEACCKLVAQGIVRGKDAYFRSGWNVLDGFVTIISLLSVSPTNTGSLSSLRSLRTLRALRPIRLISRHSGMRTVVTAITLSLPSMLATLLVFAVMLLVFSVVGTHHFKGTFSRCSVDVLTITASVNHVLEHPVPFSELPPGPAAFFNSSSYSAFVGVPSGRQVCGFISEARNDSSIRWTHNQVFNFNNVLQSMNTLLQISTFEGWVDLMYASTDRRGVDQQPVTDNDQSWQAFYIVFILVMSFTVMNMFSGAIMESFTKARKQLGAWSMMTDRQIEWVKCNEAALKLQPLKHVPPPRFWFQRLCLRIVKFPPFDKLLLACSLLNAITLAMVFYGAPPTYLIALRDIGYLNLSVFVTEAVLKITGLGARYFTDMWNLFDFVSVFGSLIGLIVSLVTGVQAGPVASVVRVFRLVRILKIAKRARSLRVMFETLIAALPAIFNVTLLLFLFIFVYACVGVQLFAHVQLQSHLNAHANFQSLGLAMLTLFRSFTGEKWNYLMADLGTESPTCDADILKKPWAYKLQFCGFSTDSQACLPIPGCGNISQATAFYLTFIIIIVFLFRSVYIAVVVESFNIRNELESAILSQDTFAQFQRAWLDFDKAGAGVLPLHKLEPFLRSLAPPMGFLGLLKVYDNSFVTFWDVLVGVTRVAFEPHVGTWDFSRTPSSSSLASTPSPRWRRGWKPRNAPKFAHTEAALVQEVVAAQVIKRALRKFHKAARAATGSGSTL